MHFDPYEPKKDRKRRIQSNISLAVIIALFIFGIILMMLPNNYGKKYYFDSTTTQVHTFSENISGQNEFSELYKAMIVPTNEFEMDNGFSKQYPTASKLFDMDASVYDEEKPYILYGGGYMAVAQCFYSTNENIKTLDVALFGFDAALDQETATIKMNDITRYTLIYDAASGSINYMKYDKSKYTMQITSFTVTLGGGTMKQAGYELSLTPDKKLSDIDREMLKNTVMDVANNSYQKPSVSESDGRMSISLTQNGNAFVDKMSRYKFDMSGDAPDSFDGFAVTAKFQGGTRSDDIFYSFTISG